MSGAAHNPSCPCLACIQARKVRESMPPSDIPVGPNHLPGCPCYECQAVRDAQQQAAERGEEARQSAMLAEKRQVLDKPPMSRRVGEHLIRTIKLDPFARFNVHPWHELYRQQADPKLHERNCICHACEQAMQAQQA